MTNFIFIDTNIILYSISEEAKEHEESIEIIRNIYKRGVGIVSPLVINEAHYNLCKQFGKERTLKYLLGFLEASDIEISNLSLNKNDIKAILKISYEYNLKTTDAFHAYHCKKLKIKQIASFDSDFKKIPWLKYFSAD